MADLPEHLKIASSPIAPDSACVVGDHYRITVLTNALVRIEWSPSGRFEDRASQMALHRDFAYGDFQVIRDDFGVQVITSNFHLRYDEQPFSPQGLVVQGRDSYHAEWRYGDVLNNDFPALAERRANLKGTTRTLDAKDGEVPLDDGLMNAFGMTALDDSHTLVLSEDGWLANREEGSQDWYVFAHGHDYQGALDDFFQLCGPQPRLPRWALGNWWSRYYAYTDEQYRELMTRFAKEQLPLSVAVVDMDWHLVDIDPTYGHGWTGFTWNKELFPDPDEFMDWLHEQGLKVSLNIHPADGIRAYEDAYPDVAKAMGIDPATEQPVNFEIADPEFVQAYFTHVLHPLEQRGVDMWWIDWQQGGHSRMPGLDPLWALNHYHFLDSGRSGARPMTFSRYAGPGSHRYPVGFSGDTVISWESLAFQPYFTSTASNIGYGWWSHDIGGHCFGVKDDELETRWVQFGVFSPIMRLHSTNDEFNGKEPWRYNKIAEQIQGDFMRLRHRMIPYLYTMNEVSHQGIPLMRPMYYTHPEDDAAYRVDNQYWFGTELIAAPITAPVTRPTGLACQEVWLPEGVWTDVFTGTVYRGGRRLPMYRGLDTFPVLAKAGGIVPLTGEGEFGVENPTSLEIRVFAGDDGTFTLFEDDGAGEPRIARTKIDFDWKSSVLTIHPAEGELDVIPATRNVRVVLMGARRSGVRGFESTYDPMTGALTIEVGEVNAAEGVRVEFESGLQLHDNDLRLRLHTMLDTAEGPFFDKTRIWLTYQAEPIPERLSGMLRGYSWVEPTLLAATLELVEAQIGLYDATVDTRDQ